MPPTPPTRKQFAHLARKSGPHGWQNRCAADLGYCPSYVSRIVRGLMKSAPAEAAIAEWRRTNL